MNRYLLFSLLLVIGALFPSPCRADNCRSDQIYEFAGEELRWHLESYLFTSTEHRYHFTGHYWIKQEGRDRHYCKEKYRYHFDIDAKCIFEKQTGNFREELTITPVSYRHEFHNWKFGHCDGTTVAWYTARDKGELNTRWRFTTTGTTFGGVSGDPWLSYFPSKKHFPQSTTTGNFTGTDQSCWRYGAKWPAISPMSMLAMGDAELQAKLSQEAYDAPLRRCDTAIKTSNSAVIGPTRITSPQAGQVFENGYVSFQLEIPCEFSFGYDKHYFQLTLERCRGQCVQDTATITIPKQENGGSRPKFKLPVTSWEPVSIPWTENNRINMTRLVGSKCETSYGSRAIKIPYDGEGQKFRLKAQAMLWNGQGYVKGSESKWRYFWLGKNLQRPDFIVSKVDMVLVDSSELEFLEFLFFVKEVGNPTRIKLMDGRYRPELRIEWTRDGKPVIETTTLNVSVKPGGVDYAWLDIPKPVKATAFQFKVTVDPENRIPEINEDNNTMTAGISWAGHRPWASPYIRVKMPEKGVTWRAGKQHRINWDGFGIKSDRRVRVFLVPCSSIGPERKVELSPPNGYPFYRGGHGVKPPLSMPSGHYQIYLEMINLPAYRTLSDCIITIVGGLGGLLKPGISIHDRKKQKLTGHLPAGVTPPKKPALKPGHKPPAQIRMLKLKTPRGMETFYLGQTCDITWQYTGIKGRIRIILEDEHGKKRTLNGMMGTKVGKKHFPWKIGSNIKPGSMYKIYLKTPDGKVKSKKSGGFNIHRIDADKAKKLLKKKNRKLHKLPKTTIHLN